MGKNGFRVSLMKFLVENDTLEVHHACFGP